MAKLNQRALRSVLLAALLVASGGLGLSRAGVALAYPTSTSTNSSGNCNNWHAHGWSWTQWSSGSSSDWGGLDAYLSWWDGALGKYDIIYHDPSQSSSGASGNLTEDYYDQVYDYGTGWWSEDGYHTGSWISGKLHSQTCIWCD